MSRHLATSSKLGPVRRMGSFCCGWTVGSCAQDRIGEADDSHTSTRGFGIPVLLSRAVAFSTQPRKALPSGEIVSGPGAAKRDAS